jgi:hypothetical protein
MQRHDALRQTFLAIRSSFAVIGLVALGCGDGRNIPKVYEVKGSVLINGQPASDVLVVLNRTSGEKLATPATSQGLTDAKGDFYISTYNTDDGAPEGDYVVTIEWRERSGPMGTELGGPDRLGGAYAKVEKTKEVPGFAVKVTNQPLELPPFKLTQSAAAKAKLDSSKKGPMGFNKDR